MKERYESVELEVIELTSADIVTASCTDDNELGPKPFGEFDWGN